MDASFIRFPKGAVVCAPGDYLLCHGRPTGCAGWRVYRVEDLLLVKRLVPVLPDPATLMLEEQVLDSVAPAYFNDVQLLLTAFDPGFADEAEALRAVDRRSLTARATGVLRPAREFAEPECRVVGQGAVPVSRATATLLGSGAACTGRRAGPG
jgi:hypothetical protein